MVLTYDEIQKQIADLQKQAIDIKKAEASDALKQAKNLISKYGFNAKDLGLSTKPSSVKKSNPKYKLDKNNWTGKGRKPKWVIDYLASGKSLDDIKI